VFERGNNLQNQIEDKGKESFSLLPPLFEI